MRTALAILTGLACALASARVRAQAPQRLSLRLDYARGEGGEACPVETAFRQKIAHRLGYDPFDQPDAAYGRLHVVVGRGELHGVPVGFAAVIERYAASGEQLWKRTFPESAWTGECAALLEPLASNLRAALLPPGAPPPEPAPAAPAPAPAASPAPTVEPEKLPGAPDVPNPERSTAKLVAIVAYSVGGVFLGLAIGWAAYGQSKANAAQALATQYHPTAGNTACRSGSVSSVYCGNLLAAWQNTDTALTIRSGCFAAASGSAVVGAVATVFAVNLPTMISGQSQVTLSRGGVVLSGSF